MGTNKRPSELGLTGTNFPFGWRGDFCPLASSLYARGNPFHFPWAIPQEALPGETFPVFLGVRGGSLLTRVQHRPASSQAHWRKGRLFSVVNFLSTSHECFLDLVIKLSSLTLGFPEILLLNPDGPVPKPPNLGYPAQVWQKCLHFGF